MPARQPNARSRNPNELAMTCVATYERRIGAGIERVWENVLDWEHLAHLHDTSFDHIEPIEGGDWGWRVHSNAEHTAHIELVVADARSYVSRTYAEGVQNAEIWTFLTPRDDDATDIRVEFDLPDIAPDRRERVGQAMLGLYTRLWDEDEAMMVERARRLREARAREHRVDLGPRDALALPRLFQLGGREYRLTEADGTLRALPTICPHLLGPLPETPAADGTLICPWHGYRFDLATRACVWPERATCRLPPAPTVEENEDRIIVRV